MGRLFWKIFLWFLAVLLLLIATLLWNLRYSSNLNGEHDTILSRALNQRLDAVAAIMQYGGPDAVSDFLRSSTPTPLRLWVLDENNKDLLGRRYPLRLRLIDPAQLISREVKDATGKTYRLVIFRPIVIERRWLGTSNTPNNATWPSLLIILVSSALACAWLAWYISRPVRLLREAAQALTTGETKTSITQKLGRRRDELTDLAAEFDHMAAVLDANQQTLRQLLNDVSHELRSPLTRLRLQVGLLEQGGQSISSEQLARMDRELSRLDDLVNQVLTMARMEADVSYQLTDYVDLVALLQDLVNDISLEAESKNVTLTGTSELDELILPANQELLRRALENVLRNAVHHTPPGKAITAYLSGDADHCEIRIHDSGPGIEPDKLDKIFQPFFRADNSRSHNGGYGLGLAIAQRAIRLHHGEVSAHN
ncbi:MAG: ATP-binding protein, partial [Chromatiales bacterium]|nr:ATP-binding protein [Chromatiales bacterium]